MRGLLTIVMYHYVREIKDSLFPNVRGLELEGFRNQLDYLQERYTMITAQDLVHCVKRDASLPDNACMLTFDDGYKDHIQYVFPELQARGIQGCFFPPARPIMAGTLLDVNAIHHILACAPSAEVVLQDLKSLCQVFGLSETEFQKNWAYYAKPNRFDTAEVIFIKRMLQVGLPMAMRSQIATVLFEKYVGRAESEFCRDLYMSVEDLRTLSRNGMYVGNHSYSHCWMSHEDIGSQSIEISRSLEFLETIGAPIEDWIMCYPYGDYNAQTINILKRTGCAVGLTTKPGIANLDEESAFELSRFDTNDFPQ